MASLAARLKFSVTLTAPLRELDFEDSHELNKFLRFREPLLDVVDAFAVEEASREEHARDMGWPFFEDPVLAALRSALDREGLGR